MSWSTAIANLRRELKEHVATAIAQIFVVTQIGKASEIGTDDALESADEDDPGKRQRGQRPATRVQPWGVSGRPTSKARGVGLRLGASNLLFIGILPTEGYGPQDLKDGETALYSAAVERGVHLDENGDTKFAAATGRTVQVNGSDYAMPKWDPFATAFKTFVNSVATITPNPPVTLVNCAAALASIINAAITLNTAMTTNSNYASTKAKNG